MIQIHKRYAIMKASIKSVRGTAPMTTQQPGDAKVLKADRW